MNWKRLITVLLVPVAVAIVIFILIVGFIGGTCMLVPECRGIPLLLTFWIMIQSFFWAMEANQWLLENVMPICVPVVTVGLPLIILGLLILQSRKEKTS